MFTNSKLTKSIRLVMAIGAASTAVIASNAAIAQEGTGSIEKISVTGSRIKRADIEGANPIQILSQEDIKVSGITNVGDLLQQIPSVAGAATNSSINNGGSGAVRVSLRGLGSQYTLVLINGRRVAPSGTGANNSVDLSNIPTNIIQRVEILKDGASAVYGSDAIGGVVNIVTRNDFTGAEFGISTDESSENGDGATRTFDFTLGVASDKGSALVSGFYSRQEAQRSGNRDWSKFDFGTSLTTGERTPGGSSAPPWSRLNGVNSANPANFTQLRLDDDGLPDLDADGAQQFDLPDGTCDSFTHGAANGPGQSDPTQFSSPTSYECWDWDTDTYNYAPANYHLTPSEKYGVYAQADYQLTDNVRFFTELAYTNRSAETLLAPIPLAPLAFFATQAPYSADNYYNQLLGPEDLNGDTVEIADWRRRVVETGGRLTQFELNTSRAVLGFDGEIFDTNWAYEVSYVFGKNSSSIVRQGGVNFEKVATAVGPSFLDATSGEVLCGTPDAVVSGCVPLNIFGIPGSDTQVSEEMLSYISFDANDLGNNKQQVFSAVVFGDAFELPAGPLSLAVGIEHREESSADLPDALIALGVTSGSSRTATRGGYDIDEIYVEATIPVLDSLDVDVAVRYSDYSTFGDTTNSKVGVKWRPIDELMLRGTFSTAFRAPSTSDLFAGNSDNSPEVVDPCNTNPTSFCIADGVPAAGFQPIGDQLSSTLGGNPSLQPEEADTYTLGVVYSPEFVEGLELTLDYWNIELVNAISTVGENLILESCAASGLYCDQITRFGPDAGALYGNSIDIDNRNTNVGGIDSSGFDFNARYAFDTELGQVRLNFDTTFYDTYDKTLADGSVVEHAGKFIRLGGDGNFPEWKINLSAGLYGDNWTANYVVRYIDSVEETIGTVAADKVATVFSGFRTELLDSGRFAVNRDVESQTVHDVRFTYYYEQYSVSLGITNLFDVDPPFADTGFNDNTDPRTYATINRHWSVKLTASF
jgi:iron complex outermembrane receptor protein